MSAPLDPDAAASWLGALFEDAHRFPYVVAGVNDDDCAVLQLGHDVLVVTTDFINASPIALELGIGNLYDLGRLVVAVNLADLCGSGADPRAMLIGATMPRGSSDDELRLFAEGVRDAAAEWNVAVVGGDTKLGASRALLGVAVGVAGSADDLFLKNRAQPEEDVWISGPIGRCAAAVVGLTSFTMPSEWQQWAKDAVIRPTLPLGLSRAASKLGVVRCGIDISDGLAADLSRLCQASLVGVRIVAQAIPHVPEVADIASQLGVPSWALALTIGGDLQFLITAPTRARDDLERIGFIRIGATTAELNMTLSLPDGRTIQWPREGHRDARQLSFADEVRRLAEWLASEIDPSA